MHSTDIPKTPGVYKIFFLDPDLLYIGSSVNLQYRFQGHRKDLRKGRHGNSHLQHAYNKYGDDAFHFEVMELVERKEDLIEREQHYLDTLKPYYNINPLARSSLGVKRSPEVRAKNGDAHRGRPSPLKGRKRPPELVAEIATKLKGLPAWNKGKPWDKKNQQRLRTMNKGKPNPHPGNPGPRKFTPLSLEIRAAKFRATQAAKSPEERAQSGAKQSATKAAKKALKLKEGQLSLWDDNLLA